MTNRAHASTIARDLATWSSWRSVLLRTKAQLRDDHITLTAAGVAFFAFLALIPFLGALISAYGLLTDPTRVRELVDSLGAGVPESARELIVEQLTAIAETSSGSLSIGLVAGIATGLWSASSGFDKLIEGMNIAYDTDDDPRPMWRRRALAVAFALGSMVVMAALATLVTAVARDFSGMSLAFTWAAVLVVFGLCLAVVYRYGPHRDDPQWVFVSIGSVFTVVVWTLSSFLFAFYVSSSGSYNEVYGSLGAVVVLLLWLYLTVTIVMIGAELNAESERVAAGGLGDDSDSAAHSVGVGETDRSDAEEAAA